jgi:alkanesulfonate monooxygenase SsuD/methylene tetrahydromethanopterin reductase-like flavin-dependent oxidoreductase (luciferase family)
MSKRTKWGVFSLSQYPDQTNRVDALEADMKLFELAEALGYDTAWLAEHLFSTYGIATSVQVIAASVLQRVKRMRIGSAVCVVPFNHPLRTAADYALVDCLSRGRLNFGIGRAYQPHEFLGLDIEMSDSREMFNEGIELILKAWTREKFTHEGKFWQIPEAIEMLPKPVQEPHPPVYQASISPESFDKAAENGWSLQLAAPFSYRTYREEWIPKLADEIKRYEDNLVKHGYDPSTLERMILLPYYVDRDSTHAHNVLAPHVEWFYEKVSSHQLNRQDTAPVKGYEFTMSEGAKSRAMGYLEFDKLAEHDACVVGSPQECVDKISRMKEAFGLTEVVIWPNLGGMLPTRAENVVRLTWDEVVPHV